MYEGLNYTTRALVESMCNGEFTSKTAEEAWDFLEDVAEKSMQWETMREPERHAPTRGMHVISGPSETDA